jgi:hypothetical protein
MTYRTKYREALIRRPQKKSRTRVGAAVENTTIDWLYKKAADQQVSISHMIDILLTKACEADKSGGEASPAS